MFLYYFDVLMLKIKKIYYFNAFSNTKHFKTNSCKFRNRKLNLLSLRTGRKNGRCGFLVAYE